MSIFSSRMTRQPANHRLYTLSDALIQCVADTLPLDHDAKVRPGAAFLGGLGRGVEAPNDSEVGG